MTIIRRYSPLFEHKENKPEKPRKILYKDDFSYIYIYVKIYYRKNIITIFIFFSSTKHKTFSFVSRSCNIINIRQNNKSYARDMKNFARLLTPQFATFTYIYDFFPLAFFTLSYHKICHQLQ